MAEPRGRAAFVERLDARAAAGRPARLWLRDDDATDATPALARLIDITAAHGIVPVIAAVPVGASPALAEALAGSSARIAVHGIAHRNWAPPGEKKRELGPDRPVDVMVEALRSAHAALAALAGPAFTAMLVPPWNRIANDLVPHLASIGFTALSLFGPRASQRPMPDLQVINTHLDIIDWRGTRRTLPDGLLFERLADVLDGATDEGGDEPVGILTHHLVHDDAAWRFLDDLMELTSAHPGAEWIDVGEIVERRAA